jgi:hypothetical protein
MLSVFPFLFRRGAAFASSKGGGVGGGGGRDESTRTVTPATVPLSPGEELRRKKDS